MIKIENPKKIIDSAVGELIFDPDHDHRHFMDETEISRHSLTLSISKFCFGIVGCCISLFQQLCIICNPRIRVLQLFTVCNLITFTYAYKYKSFLHLLARIKNVVRNKNDYQNNNISLGICIRVYTFMLQYSILTCMYLIYLYNLPSVSHSVLHTVSYPPSLLDIFSVLPCKQNYQEG